MEATSQDNKIGLAKAIGIGVIGSLLGTIAMDLVQVVQFLIMGEPVLTYLNLIGSVLGGGIRLGTVVHILIGATLGVVFIVPVLTIGILHIDTFRKSVVVGTVIGAVSIVLAYRSLCQTTSRCSKFSASWPFLIWPGVWSLEWSSATVYPLPHRRRPDDLRGIKCLSPRSAAQPADGVLS